MRGFQWKTHNSCFCDVCGSRSRGGGGDGGCGGGVRGRRAWGLNGIAWRRLAQSGACFYNCTMLPSKHFGELLWMQRGSRWSSEWAPEQQNLLKWKRTRGNLVWFECVFIVCYVIIWIKAVQRGNPVDSMSREVISHISQFPEWHNNFESPKKT